MKVLMVLNCMCAYVGPSDSRSFCQGATTVDIQMEAHCEGLKIVFAKSRRVATTCLIFFLLRHIIGRECSALPWHRLSEPSNLT